MKIFEAIQAERLKRVAPASRFVRIDPEFSVTQLDIPNQYRWQYGICLRCFFTGPEEGEEQYGNQARRLIAREVYGEIIDDLIELSRVLMEESYRPATDPALAILENSIRKMQGC